MVYFGDRSTGNCVDINQVQIYSSILKFFRWLVYLSPNVTSCMDFFNANYQWKLDVEVRITSIQEMHMFRWDRICQRIKCNPWSTRFFPHPHHYKEDENLSGTGGRLGPKPQSQTNQFRPPFPNTNPQIRKESKMTEKRKRLIPTKKYKVKVVARPDPNNATMQLPQESAPVNPES